MPEKEKKKIFKSSNEEVAEILQCSISGNKELKKLEIEGFVKGTKEGKTMNVPILTIIDSLKKQWKDWEKVRFSSNPGRMKRALADLRNVAGCLFLKLQEVEK